MNSMRRGPEPKWLKGAGSVDKRHDPAMAIVASKIRNDRDAARVGFDMLQSVTNCKFARAMGDEAFSLPVGRHGTGDDSFRPANGTAQTETIVARARSTHSTMP